MGEMGTGGSKPKPDSMGWDVQQDPPGATRGLQGKLGVHADPGRAWLGGLVGMCVELLWRLLQHGNAVRGARCWAPGEAAGTEVGSGPGHLDDHAPAWVAHEGRGLQVPDGHHSLRTGQNLTVLAGGAGSAARVGSEKQGPCCPRTLGSPVLQAGPGDKAGEGADTGLRLRAAPPSG